MKQSQKQIFCLAKRQITLNKRKTFFVNLSLVFSMLLIIFIHNIYTGLDLNKYISGFIKTDFTIGAKDYFDMEYCETSVPLDNTIIQAVNQMEGFVDGGCLYYYTDRQSCSMYSDMQVTDTYMFDLEGNPLIDLYGADDFILDNMSVYQGKMDFDKLRSGNYIVYGVETDDYGNVTEETVYSIGDIVTIKVNGIDYKYEIMAVVKKEHSLNTVKYWSKYYAFYLPTQEYMNITQSEDVMAYMLDVNNDSLESFEAYLYELNKDMEEDWGYKTRETYKKEFDDMKKMILAVGIILLIVVTVIALINFCNVIITSILNRKNELAIMQTMGMTTRQMREMLILEGGYYWFWSNVVTVIAGSILSHTLLKILLDSIWFLKYNFSLIPVLYISPLLLLLVCLVPGIVFEVINHQGLNGRLKSDYL